MAAKKGFFSVLFDFSFETYVTLKFLRLFYGLALLVIGLGAAGLALAGFQEGVVAGLAATFIVAPLVSLFAIIAARIGFELVSLAFTSVDLLRQIKEALELPRTSEAR